jgi:phenylpropionate dioxygenase-like ring-hydroxylating dioxygenase large terminal subunit
MRIGTQREIVRRLLALAEAGTTQLADAPLTVPATDYTDPARFAAEQRLLFRDRAVVAAMSCDLRAPGDVVTGTSGGVPYVVLRHPDGGVRAFANICRHRGAPVVADGTDHVARSFRCGFHGWVYDLDGMVTARPHAHGGFDAVADACASLLPLAAAEAHGLVFVRTGGPEPIDVDAVLAEAGDEIADFGFDGYRRVARWTSAWAANWKLLADTFLETYHVPALHPTTVARHFVVAPSAFDALGPNLRFHSLMRSLAELRDQPEEEWRLLPHGTVEYVVVPATILNFSVDHLALYRLLPVAVDRTEVELSLYVPDDAAPAAPAAPPDDEHWRRTLDLHRRVSGGEDFTMQERVHRGLESGLLPEVVFGRNEPAAIAFHRSLDALLAG